MKQDCSNIDVILLISLKMSENFSENMKGFINKRARGDKSLKDFLKLTWPRVAKLAIIMRLSASKI